MQNSILVSCTVVSYNSEKTIIETLDSIKAQTYQNIELIVSDDCSTDNTVEVCRAWIEKNKDRFSRVKLITSDHNTGVPGNGNRAIAECRGEWQKGIAADDILLPNCIEDFMRYVKDHPEAMWISSYIRRYNETFEENNCVKRKCVISRSFFDLDAKDQLKKLAINTLIYAPSLFSNTGFLKSIGYDTKYLHEDLPFYVNALERGFKCHFIDKETICYRIHESLSNTSQRLFNYNNLKEFRRFRTERLFKYLSKRQIRGTLYLWKIEDLIEKVGLNKRTILMNFIYHRLLALYSKVYG